MIHYHDSNGRKYWYDGAGNITRKVECNNNPFTLGYVAE